jgi:hypothetical protein
MTMMAQHLVIQTLCLMPIQIDSSELQRAIATFDFTQCTLAFVMVWNVMSQHRLAAVANERRVQSGIMHCFVTQ